MYTTIITLYKQGNSQRNIAKLTRIDRKTVSKIVNRYVESGTESPVPYERSSALDSWHEQIIELLEKNLSYIRIFEELKIQGYTNSYGSLTRYIKKYKTKLTLCWVLNIVKMENVAVAAYSHLTTLTLFGKPFYQLYWQFF